MKSIGKAGRWTRLFGCDGSFRDEIKQARLVDAQWSKDAGALGVEKSGHTTVSFVGLSGWLMPLWASDGEWLYARRPEGLWKTRIPKDLWLNAPVYFVQSKLGNESMIGRMYLSTGLPPTDGWREEFGDKATPEELDDRFDPRRAGINVDLVCPPFLHYDGDENRIVAIGGDEFCSPPRFEMVGDWLIATDVDTGIRAGYLLNAEERARTALDRGALWIRFSGRFLAPFDVKVCL